MKLAIASGKGGTGKTTVAVNLAALLAARGHCVSLADCDVEEPNAHLFLPVEWKTRENCTLPVPKVNDTLCLGAACRRCVDACRFKALAFMGDAVLDFPDLCHGCGLCALVCPTGAMTYATRLVGEVRGGIARIRPAMGDGKDAKSPAGEDSGGSMPTLRFRDGVLRIGEAMATPLIKAVKDAPLPAAPCATGRATPQPCAIDIRDCPPGVACATINAVHDADFMLLVAEPSPFGLHDLRLAVALARHLGLPHAVVLNRAGMGAGIAAGMGQPGTGQAQADPVRDWTTREGVPLLGVIPFSRAAAECGASGSLVHDAAPEVRSAYTRLADAIEDMACGNGGPGHPRGRTEPAGNTTATNGAKERTCDR